MNYDGIIRVIIESESWDKVENGLQHTIWIRKDGKKASN